MGIESTDLIAILPELTLILLANSVLFIDLRPSARDFRIIFPNMCYLIPLE